MALNCELGREYSNDLLCPHAAQHSISGRHLQVVLCRSSEQPVEMKCNGWTQGCEILHPS